jgi:hypothetical protein
MKVIKAPNQFDPCDGISAISIFLAGSIEMGLAEPWQERLVEEFNAFPQGKVTTQRMSGGNTEEFYKHEGTMNKSQMLADLHPDVASVVWRFNRWHHHVDYTPFKKNKLILKETISIPDTINEYDFKLVNSIKELP